MNCHNTQLKESQTHIIVWHLSVWEEVTGILQDIIISTTSCQIQFVDGVNICIPLPDESLLQRLNRMRCKNVSICRTDISARRYLFNFNSNVIICNNSSSIRQMGDEEIAALKALHGWSINQDIRKKSRIRYNENQQQLHTWMGGND